MAAKYQLMIDPNPAGWAYGFPKALPEHAIHGKGADLFIRKNFDLTEWIVTQGYPEESFQYFRTYVQEVLPAGEWPKEVDEAAEKMGDLKFTTAGDYIYPGSDCQE